MSSLAGPERAGFTCRRSLASAKGMTMSQDRRYSFEFFPTKTDAGHEKLMASPASWQLQPRLLFLHLRRWRFDP
jgi:hypothetical protein